MGRKERTVEIPWTSTDQPEAGPVALVMASKFELRSAARSPLFLVHSLRLWRQARRSAGIMGVSLRAQPLTGTFWTLSAWTGQQALDAFARTSPHASLTKRIRPWTKNSTFRFWSVPASEIASGTFRPAGLWADAVARIAADEPSTEI
jgi:hypothetical protein